MHIRDTSIAFWRVGRITFALASRAIGLVYALMSEMMTPDELAALARKNGMSIRAMCIRAGLDTSSFWRWKTGQELGVNKYFALVEAASRPLDAVE